MASAFDAAERRRRTRLRNRRALPLRRTIFFVKKLKWITQGLAIWPLTLVILRALLVAMAESRGFYWTGVLNNYTEEELNALTSLDCPELVVDKEVGEEGTPHLHIYLKAAKRLRLNQLKALSPRAHWEVVRDREAAIRYCSKGELVQKRLLAPISRSRIESALDSLRRGGVRAVAHEHPESFVLHYRGFQALEQYQLDAVPKPVPIVSWYYGDTGTGKTRAAYEMVSEDNIYIQNGPNSKHGAMWWDGYLG